MVLRQASMVSFVTIFRLLGVLFLIMIPLVLLMQTAAKGSGAGSGALSDDRMTSRAIADCCS